MTVFEEIVQRLGQLPPQKQELVLALVSELGRSGDTVEDIEWSRFSLDQACAGFDDDTASYSMGDVVEPGL